MLRAEEELFLQLGMTKRAELLRDAMLFAVGSGICALGGSEMDPCRDEVRAQGGDGGAGDGENPEDGDRSQSKPFHDLFPCEWMAVRGRTPGSGGHGRIFTVMGFHGVGAQARPCRHGLGAQPGIPASGISAAEVLEEGVDRPGALPAGFLGR